MALPRSVLLIITGSVASYKSLELIRLLRARKVEVTAILSKGGSQFITPLAVSSLTGTKTYTDLFSLTDETEMGHIQLSRVAECVLVAPASANIMAKMAAGITDDLATTALLATNKPVFIAPAMNHKMWEHAATQRNVKQLVADGITMIAPTAGDMACGEHGIGRMAEPADIVAFLARHPGLVPGSPTTHRISLAGDPGIAEANRDDSRPLTGRHAVVTSGPTAEALDPVRYLGNRSSGKQGHAIAAALAQAGAKVTLISGKVSIPHPAGVTVVETCDADAMLAAVNAALPADIFVAAAAVADWRLANPAAQKMKKKAGVKSLTLEFIPTVDILATIAKGAKRPTLVIGFAAETEKLLEHARAKRLKKNCDWLIANDVSGGQVFGADDNNVTFITATSEEAWPHASKADVAGKLTQKIASHFASKSHKGKTA
jgi:phosphopantothenoylcysteine decarboxylase / phosphopantothenate---cysteine ligase